jgi:hypothetical protein
MTQDKIKSSRKPKEKAAKQDRNIKNIRDGEEENRTNSPKKSNVNNSSKAKKQGNTLSSNDLKGTEFERGTLVWVRIKGFPWWPGIIVSETDVPEKQRKVWACTVLFLPVALTPPGLHTGTH